MIESPGPPPSAKSNQVCLQMGLATQRREMSDPLLPCTWINQPAFPQTAARIDIYSMKLENLVNRLPHVIVVSSHHLLCEQEEAPDNSGILTI